MVGSGRTEGLIMEKTINLSASDFQRICVVNLSKDINKDVKWTLARAGVKTIKFRQARDGIGRWG